MGANLLSLLTVAANYENGEKEIEDAPSKEGKNPNEPAKTDAFGGNHASDLGIRIGENERKTGVQKGLTNRSRAGMKRFTKEALAFGVKTSFRRGRKTLRI
jgi:hypothetical protein